jgi:hypothetical protein
VPTQTKKASTSKAKKAAPKATKTAPKAPSRAEQARAAAERAVDLPVGAVLEVSDRVADVFGPFTDRAKAERQLRSYRASLRRTAKRTERRGAGVRRKATTEAKKTRNRVEREARRRQRTVETTLKRNRNDVEKRVRTAIDEQTSRAQDLVDQLRA